MSVLRSRFSPSRCFLFWVCSGLGARSCSLRWTTEHMAPAQCGPLFVKYAECRVPLIAMFVLWATTFPVTVTRTSIVSTEGLVPVLLLTSGVGRGCRRFGGRRSQSLVAFFSFPLFRVIVLECTCCACWSRAFRCPMHAISFHCVTFRGRERLGLLSLTRPVYFRDMRASCG